MRSVAPGSRRGLLRRAAGCCPALVVGLAFDSGAARGPAQRLPVPPRQPPALLPLQTRGAGGEWWQRCAPVPCTDDLGRPGSHPAPSQPGAQPRTLGACLGARRRWPGDCPGQVGGVASASSRLGSPLALEGAAPPDPGVGRAASLVPPSPFGAEVRCSAFSEASQEWLWPSRTDC